MSVAHFTSPDSSAIQKGADPTDLSPTDRLARLAFGEADLPEITQRRRCLRNVQRFFGLDIHRDYLVATAVDRELRVVSGPTRLPWNKFEAWIAQHLSQLDAIVVETPAPTAGAV